MTLLRKKLLLGAVALVTAVGSFSYAAPAQAANITDGFNPGNIIEDREFYNGRGMTVAQIQNFLNSKNPVCRIGSVGNEPGKRVGNTHIASQCLKDYRMATVSKPANQLCAAYAGVRSESAAQIIAKVGAACSINPRVLLVMLEKEQSLVTTSVPTRRQIDVAMGYACPDSGPNWSANCDPAFYGFQNQVYNAAMQIQRYKAYPHLYRYRAGVVNTVQYHPNPACGTARFTIQNNATAALYIYTPYVPNKSALAAGWGTGDSCAAYGNRNFFNFYKSWFGYVAGGGAAATPAFTVKGAIGQAWHAAGGAKSVYGLPTSNEYILNGATIQQFQNGAAVWTNPSGAHFVTGAIRGRYLVEGGVTGKLGIPISGEYDTATGRAQKFQNGIIEWNRATRGITVTMNGETPKPTTPTATTPGYTKHPNGFETGGAIGALWNYYGGAKSIYGLPTSNEVTADGVVTQTFAAGRGFWSTTTKAQFVGGAIMGRYMAEGGHTGKLGLPIAPEYDTATGRAQKFQNGIIEWNRATRGITVTMNGETPKPTTPTATTPGYTKHPNGFETGGAIGALWNYYGGAKSIYGLPTSNEYEHNGYILQQFTNGAAVWTAKTKAHMLTGAIRSRYVTENGVDGRLGLPISEEYDTPTGRAQVFQHGVINWYRSGGTTVTIR